MPSSLFHNLWSPHLVNNDVTFFLRASPYGGGLPPIPVAHDAAISPLASPISFDRGFSNVYLGALKTFLTYRKPIVKIGDSLSITLRCDYSRLIYPTNPTSPKSSDEDLVQFTHLDQ